MKLREYLQGWIGKPVQFFAIIEDTGKLLAVEDDYITVTGENTGGTYRITLNHILCVYAIGDQDKEGKTVNRLMILSDTSRPASVSFPNKWIVKADYW